MISNINTKLPWMIRLRIIVITPQNIISTTLYVRRQPIRVLIAEARRRKANRHSREMMQLDFSFMQWIVELFDLKMLSASVQIFVEQNALITQSLYSPASNDNTWEYEKKSISLWFRFSRAQNNFLDKISGQFIFC